MKAEMTYSDKELRRILRWAVVYRTMAASWKVEDSKLYNRLRKAVGVLEEQESVGEEGNDPDRNR